MVRVLIKAILGIQENAGRRSSAVTPSEMPSAFKGPAAATAESQPLGAVSRRTAKGRTQPFANPAAQSSRRGSAATARQRATPIASTCSNADDLRTLRVQAMAVDRLRQAGYAASIPTAQQIERPPVARMRESAPHFELRGAERCASPAAGGERAIQRHEERARDVAGDLP